MFVGLVTPKAGGIWPLHLCLGKCLVLVKYKKKLVKYKKQSQPTYKRATSYNWSLRSLPNLCCEMFKEMFMLFISTHAVLREVKAGHGRNTQTSEQLSVALAKGPTVKQGA